MKEIIKLLEKYYKAESTLEEEQAIKLYFKNSSLVHPSIEADSALFIALLEESKIKSKSNLDSYLKSIGLEINVDSLLEKYYQGKTSPEEEKILQTAFSFEEKHPLDDAYFEALKEERSLKSKMTEEQFLELIKKEDKEERSNKIIPLKKLLRYAAVLLLPLAVVFSFRFFNLANSNQELVMLEYNDMVIDDPEEALRLTKEALWFAGNQMNKGQKQYIDNIPLIEKTNIFK